MDLAQRRDLQLDRAAAPGWTEVIRDAGILDRQLVLVLELAGQLALELRRRHPAQAGAILVEKSFDAYIQMASQQ
jgi:hypothetical protein